MARRRSKTGYYRKNPLSDTEFLVGGLVTAAVVGVGGYLLYGYFQNQGQLQAQQAANASLIAANQAAGQAPLPGGTGAPTASQAAAAGLIPAG